MNISIEPVEGANTPDRRLYLVRHGETADNAAGRFLGRTDSPLNDRGVIQAQQRAATIAAFGIEAVVSSPARRALETAELLNLSDPVIESGFREIDFGDWEGLTQDEVAERDPVNFAAFTGGDISGFPGGETVAGVADRTMAAVATHTSTTLLVVTHATVIRILVVALLGLPVTRYRSSFDRPGNLSITELSCTNGAWSLESYAMTSS